jgi:mannose-6-phosphate isomerase-like protein (cupin superfamily)
MQGEYHWHKHDNHDEFFFVLHGCFIIDLEEHSIELLPNQGFTVPKGVLHCTRALERTVILMVETAAIVPTGDALDQQEPEEIARHRAEQRTR